MFKITSRFYVIYGDGNPIYVGYTNRTVRQRFTEHKESKDFSDYKKVQVKELKEERLIYNFTWDYGQTCRNADEVSLREAQLVQKYNTQNSVFQKADGGGQTWASEKYFVKSNRNNPKFAGLSASAIKRLLDRDKRIAVWLNNFVNDQSPMKEVWLNNFVSSQRPMKEVWLNTFVGHQSPMKKVWLSSFVGSQSPLKEVWLNHFVGNQSPTKEVWLHNFVHHQSPLKEVWLNHFVSSQSPMKKIWLNNFVSSQSPMKEAWLHNFVGNQSPMKEAWLHNFVGNQKYYK